MSQPSTKPPGAANDQKAEAADAAHASMLALLATNEIPLHDNAHTPDQPWLMVTDKSTDEPPRPGCSQPTRVRLICGRRQPSSARRPHHAAFLRFEWGHAESPFATLDLCFVKGTWTLVRSTDPTRLVNWPALEKLEALVGDKLRRDVSLTISEEMVAKVADWLVRAFKHHAELEARIGLGAPA